MRKRRTKRNNRKQKRKHDSTNNPRTLFLYCLGFLEGSKCEGIPYNGEREEEKEDIILFYLVSVCFRMFSFAVVQMCAFAFLVPCCILVSSILFQFILAKNRDENKKCEILNMSSTLKTSTLWADCIFRIVHVVRALRV